MISYKEAVTAAQQYASELFPPQELRGLRVEEITPADDGNYWNVTLGWVAPDVRTVTPSSFGLSRPEVVEAPRVYKKFKIDAASGTVISMVMRD